MTTNYEIYAIIDGAGEQLEGRRATLRAAFALGRRLWREYKGAARVSVRLDKTEICGDVCDMTIRQSPAARV